MGTLAATIGDNLGYALGGYGGRPLLERYLKVFRASAAGVARGEKLFQRYGSITILFSRFVFGMRVLAGPLAGTLRMPWKSFAVFNLLGAVLWVSTISLAGYFFGGRWRVLIYYMKRFDQLLVAVFILFIATVWWRNRRARSM